MHDLVIKGGTVIDGTGAASFVADVAIDGELIAKIGSDLHGRREIDATGLLVTPGFVDIHTHYDGQATWDPQMTPSSWHGVTTVVFGNCGVGFAPARQADVPYLVNLMKGVEDIPEIVLLEGINFTWESFPEYLDALATLPRTVDVAAQVPHAALRFYVMGERGADYRVEPNDEELARMGDLLEEALRAGAVGLSTSRMSKHLAGDGRNISTLAARHAELQALAQAMRRAGSGVIEVNSEWGPGEVELLTDMARTAGRPMSCLLVQFDAAPEHWRSALAAIHRARAQGISMHAQVGVRPIGMMMGLETSINPFAAHPLWQAMADLTPRQRYERLRDDGALRQRLIDDDVRDPILHRILAKLPRATIQREEVDYEPVLERDSVGAIAAARGMSVRAVALELFMQRDGRGLLFLPHENYAGGDLAAVRDMLTDDATVIGVGDGGAHLSCICDSSSPTVLLTHWARDRQRGPKLPLEFVVSKQTRATAEAYGLLDRGALFPGLRADINVIDFARLRVLAPEVVYDMPAQGRRLIQRAEGYRHVFVGGVETLRDDVFTGALPGKLIRGASA